MAGKILTRLNQQALKLFSEATSARGEEGKCVLRNPIVRSQGHANQPPNLPCQTKRPPPPVCNFPELTYGPSGCDKVCLPCCKKTAKDPLCHDIKPVVASCKKTEYRVPAFSECKKADINPQPPKECCNIIKPKCEVDIEKKGKKPLASVEERIDRILGQSLKKTNPCRRYSTSASPPAEDEGKKDEEKCPRNTDLPCLRIETGPGIKMPKGHCERICMPCCSPARYPPSCAIPFEKVPCTKYKTPRPAYSECLKAMVKPFLPCECSIKVPPKCTPPEGEAKPQDDKTQ